MVPRLARNIKIECRLYTIRNNIYVNSDALLMIRDRLKGVRYNLTIASDASSNTFIIRGAKFHYSKRGNLLKLWAKGPLLEEVIISVSHNYYQICLVGFTNIFTGYLFI